MSITSRRYAAGQKLIVFGKPKERAKKFYIDHPEFEIVEARNSPSTSIASPHLSAHGGDNAAHGPAAVYRVLEAWTSRASTTASRPASTRPLTAPPCAKSISRFEDQREAPPSSRLGEFSHATLRRRKTRRNHLPPARTTRPRP